MDIKRRMVGWRSLYQMLLRSEDEIHEVFAGLGTIKWSEIWTSAISAELWTETFLQRLKVSGW